VECGERGAATRFLSAPLDRAVASRDGQRCTFIGDGGKRCEARHDCRFLYML